MRITLVMIKNSIHKKNVT